MDVKVEGAVELATAFDVAPELTKRELKEALEASLFGLIPDLADYPAEPPGSTYQRTGTLGRRWTAARPKFTPSGSGYMGMIGNATPYGPYVQDFVEQTEYHADTGWQTNDEVLEQHEDDIQDRLDDAAAKAAKRIEGTR